MATGYSSGSASSFSDLMTAIVNYLVTKGYTDNAGTAHPSTPSASRILTKGNIAVRIGYDAQPCLFLYGGTGISGTSLVNQTTTDRYAKIGSAQAAPMTFPVTYEFFWSDTPEEFYVVVNYNGDKYQHLHFGKSDIPDIGGNGLWLSGSYDGGRALTGLPANSTSDQSRMYMTGTRTSSNGNGSFYTTPYGGLGGGYFAVGENTWNGGAIYCGLEGVDAWRIKGTSSGTAGALLNHDQSMSLMMALPSLFNESEVLLPIQVNMRRSSSLITPVAILRHARMFRIDNTNPGDIITYGSDQWKCFPLYAKNTVDRNGVNWTTGAYHSGTYGIALRYAP